MTDAEFEKFQKLVNDIEARKQSDELLLTVWKNNELKKLDQELAQTELKLGVVNYGIIRDIQNRKKDVIAEHEEQLKAARERHAQLDQDLADGKLHHVWINAGKEAIFNEAKPIWDLTVKNSFDHYGRMPPESVIKEFKDKYGNEIFKQLMAHTERILEKQNQPVEQKVEQTGFKRDPNEKFLYEETELYEKWQKKMDTNPVDETSKIFLKAIEKSEEKQEEERLKEVRRLSIEDSKRKKSLFKAVGKSYTDNPDSLTEKEKQDSSDNLRRIEEEMQAKIEKEKQQERKRRMDEQKKALDDSQELFLKLRYSKRPDQSQSQGQSY